MIDVRAKKVTATGALAVGGRTRIKGLNFLPVATPGSIVVNDGAAGGTLVISLDVTTGSTTNVLFPGDGVLCQGDPYVTLTTVTSVTFFYG